MAATVEERLARLEAQVAALEDQIERMERARRPAFGVTIEEAKERLRQPVARDPETIARFRSLMGSFEGPEDLSERMRDNLYGEVADEDR